MLVRDLMQALGSYDPDSLIMGYLDDGEGLPGVFMETLQVREDEDCIVIEMEES